MSKIESVKSWYSKLVEEEMEDDIARDDLGMSIVLVVVCILMVLYLAANQVWSTGLFTSAFGTLEMLLLYGSLIYWIGTSALMLLGYKDLSRDVDSFGGLIYATVSIAWLFAVFPFDFAHIADVLPGFLKFLVQWISNDIARVLLVLLFTVHLIFALFSGVLRVSVRKARAKK
ncbi:MAG: hypothetical protein ACFFD4_30065 [Candidatus Odinarchaeota archaeon]